jgi:uncharacterized protein involved in exopolysaccharide biosynthesis
MTIPRAEPSRNAGRWPDDLPEEDVTLFGLANVLLRHWRLIGGAMLVGALLGVASKLFAPAVYVASTSFMPQGTDVQRTSMAVLAGQLGIGLPTSAGTQSPKFYVDLFSSHEFLAPIASDTFTVAEERGKRATLGELYDVREKTPNVREEIVVALLSSLLSPASDAKTGIVSVSVTTKWPSISLAIAQRLVSRVNDYNLHVRQSQAGEERRFLSERLKVARDTLFEAENRLKFFLQQNRQYATSAELTFEHDRLARDVSLAQQILMSLSQSYEDAKIREVRDTPVITVTEPARLPFGPKRRRLLSRGVLGLLLGAMIAGFAVLVADAFQRRRRKDDPDVEEFVSLLKKAGRPFFRAREIPGRQ